MKKNLWGLGALLFVLFSPLVWAEVTPWLTGPFQINPGGIHRKGVAGTR